MTARCLVHGENKTKRNLAKPNRSFEAKDLADKEKLEKKAKRLANIEKIIESRNKKRAAAAKKAFEE